MSLTKPQLQSLYQKCTFASTANNQFVLTYTCRSRNDADRIQSELDTMVKTMPVASGAAFGTAYQKFGTGGTTIMMATVMVAPIQTSLGLVTRTPTPGDWRTLTSTFERNGAIPLAEKVRIDAKFCNTGKIQRI